ncbi:MAG: sulfotransferase [Chloroflexota bacterium]
MIFKKKKNKSAGRVVVVSGLPRSGTSLMMRMLDKGGIPPMQDGERTADIDNPKGYYEYERVKAMSDGDTAWLKEAGGKVVKVITALLPHLPSKYNYDVLIMRRDIKEILASQTKMLVNRGEETDKVSDEEIEKMYRKHLAKTYAWLDQQSNIRYVDVNYNLILQDPAPHVVRINDFLGGTMDEVEMAAQVDTSLYRNRKEKLNN